MDDLILELPGAVIRWLVGRLFNRKKTFLSYLKEESMANTFVGIAFLMFLIVLYIVIYNV